VYGKLGPRNAHVEEGMAERVRAIRKGLSGDDTVGWEWTADIFRVRGLGYLTLLLRVYALLAIPTLEAQKPRLTEARHYTSRGVVWV